MAKIILSDIIEDIRGTVGTHVYSYWKGVHLVKIRSVNYRTAHESAFRTAQKTFIARLSQYWAAGLTPLQRAGWNTYAEYIETLGFPYYGPDVEKLVGWKQYGGIMSGVNAFILTNQLRLSIGKTDILEDDPIAIDPPPQPNFEAVEFILGPPKKIKVSLARPIALTEDTWVRCFCRGTRYAHLIIAQTLETQISAGIGWDVDYQCNVEPDAAAPPWTRPWADFCTAAAGIITIDTITPGGVSQCAYFLDVAGLDNTIGWIVEAKLIVDESVAQDTRLTLEVYDGTYLETLDFSETGIKLKYHGGSYIMDTKTSYHIYQIRGKGTDVRVYVDGVLRITGTLSVGVANKRVFFGDKSAAAGQNSKSRWDWVKIYDGGNAPADYDYPEWQNMRYAKGAVLPLQNDIYNVQLDFISESGRYSAPSIIGEVTVRDGFPGGLWGSYLWDNYLWG